MTDQALSTLPREAKGRIAPPPALTGKLKAVADARGRMAGGRGHDALAFRPAKSRRWDRLLCRLGRTRPHPPQRLDSLNDLAPPLL